MEQLKMIKEQITSQVLNQMGDLQNVSTKELGEAIDMIKDLSEATYYCTVVKAMEEASDSKDKSTNNYYYTDHYYPHSYYRDVDRDLGRMYYSGGGNSGSGSGSGNSASSSSSGGNN